MTLRVILNPRARPGRLRDAIPRLERAMKRQGIRGPISATREPGDATRLAHMALEEGVEVLAVAGGDGTLHEIAQAYIDPSGAPLAGPTLALLPFGTGSDFARTLGAARDLESALERARSGASRPVDLGVVQHTGEDGSTLRRAFVNELSFGLPGSVARRRATSPLRHLGRASYYLTAVHSALTYTNQAAQLRVDGHLLPAEPTVSVTLANGRFFGGGMQIAPDANPSDGQLDIVIVSDLTRFRVLTLSRRIYAGTHVHVRGVHTTRATSIEARPANPAPPIPAEADGEPCAHLPLRAHLLPAALRFRV